MAEAVQRDGVESVAIELPERLLSPAAYGEAHIVDPVRGRIRRCSPNGIAAAQRAMAARPDSTAQLASISVPTLVLAGGDDALIPVEAVRALSAGIHDSVFTVFEGAGHLINLEDPHVFSAHVQEFLCA